MKFTINTKVFAQALSMANRVTPIKSFAENPLESILIEACDGKVVITASVPGIVLLKTIPAGENCQVTETGSAVVTSRSLSGIVSVIADETITVTSADTGNALIVRWGTGHSQVPDIQDGFQKDANAVPEEGMKAVFPSAELSSALGAVSYACATDEVRPVLCGVIFETGPKGTGLVGTDARALVIRDIPAVTTEKDERFVVERKLVPILNQMCAQGENVSLLVADGKTVFSTDTTTLIASPVPGKIPNFRAVVPKDNPDRLTIDRKAFQSVIKRIAVCADGVKGYIKLQFKRGMLGTELTVSGIDNVLGFSAKEVLDVEYDGNDFAVGFRAENLIDILSHLECESVRFTFDGPKRAACILPDNEEDSHSTTAVLMPVVTT